MLSMEIGMKVEDHEKIRTHYKQYQRMSMSAVSFFLYTFEKHSSYFLIPYFKAQGLNH